MIPIETAPNNLISVVDFLECSLSSPVDRFLESLAVK